MICISIIKTIISLNYSCIAFSGCQKYINQVRKEKQFSWQSVNVEVTTEQHQKDHLQFNDSTTEPGHFNPVRDNRENLKSNNEPQSDLPVNQDKSLQLYIMIAILLAFIVIIAAISVWLNLQLKRIRGKLATYEKIYYCKEETIYEDVLNFR